MFRKTTIIKGLIILLAIGALTSLGWAGLKVAEKKEELIQIEKQKQQIENAKKVWEIESLYKKGDDESILELSKFLEDDNRNIRKIASYKLILLNNKNAVKFLKEAKQKDVKGMYKIANILINSENKEVKEICKEILALKEEEIETYKNMVKELDSTENKEDKEKVFESLRKLRIESSWDFVYFFSERGCVDYLPTLIKKYPKLTQNIEYHPEVVYTKLKERINKLSAKERKNELINLLTNWKTVMEYEAVIRILSEEIGKEVIPDILELLDDQTNIPQRTPPPFERIHTNYHILLTVLKTIPDNRSIKKLNELKNNNNKFVANKTKEVLEWIKSGVPYPFKYERILFASQDEY